jgi:transposase-like protein
MARPNKGLYHVEGLQSDPQSKRRLRGILSTISGERSVDEVCRELGIGKTHFAELRRRVLQGGIDAIAPRPVGRPSQMTTPATQETEALQQRIAELERENAILHTRLELSALPSLRETPSSKSRGSRPPAAERRAIP